MPSRKTQPCLWLPAKTMYYRRKRWSLPNLEYWLAPERRENTVRYLRESG